MIAYALEKGVICSGCGTAPWEWDGDPGAFVAVNEVCMGCAAKDRTRLGQQNEGTQAGGSIRLIPRAVMVIRQATKNRRPLSARERAK